MVDELKEPSPREIQIAITSTLASLDQEIKGVLDLLVSKRKYLEGLKSVASRMQADLNAVDPIVSKGELAAATVSAHLVRKMLRRRLLLIAQEMHESGELEIGDHDLSDYGLL